MFLGPVNYSVRYIHNFADITEPLQELRRLQCAICMGRAAAGGI